MLLGTFTGVNWIHYLDKFSAFWILCMAIPESGFAVLWTLSLLNIVCVSTREWIYCIVDIVTSKYSVCIYQRVDLLFLDIVHILEHGCANSINTCIQTFCVIRH